MPELKAGLTGEVRTRVEGPLITDRGGGVRVLSTPSLVMLLEQAAQRAIAPCLTPEQISVGSRVEVQHLAATPAGHEVVARARLAQVDGRRLVFEVEADDPFEPIAAGMHERYVLDADRYRQRLAKKQLAEPSA